VRRRRALPYPNLGLSGVVPVPDGAPGSRQVVPPILDKPKIAASALVSRAAPGGRDGAEELSCVFCILPVLRLLPLSRWPHGGKRGCRDASHDNATLQTSGAGGPA